MKFRPFVVFAAFVLFGADVDAQTTVFTYQGQLSSNSLPATGTFDMRFRLFDANTNVVGISVTNSAVGVTNGLFTTPLNFGFTVFDGSDRWLEVAVRNFGSTGVYTALLPLQPVTSVPYAIRSIAATSALNAMFLSQPLQGTNVAGVIPAANLPTNAAFLTSNQIFSAVNTFNGVVTANNSGNSFSGNGSGLTALTATNLVGIINDARLSTNVALQSNPALVFAGSVTATNFTGGGHGLTNVPGAFFWVTVAGASVQMQPNVGYICTNDILPVTNTLPLSPAIGDTFKIAGLGDAGWVIAQNTNQTVLAGNLSTTIGQNWKVAAFGPANLVAIACSSDAVKLAAPINGGNIFVSTNSGSTWIAHANALNWSSIASSADGTKLVAAVGYTVYNTGASGNIFTSTDSGATWTSRASPAAWSSVASSADGNKLVATIRSGNIFTSTDSGVTWVSRDVGRLWSAVASSADGAKLVATVDSGGIYTSVNGGTNWVQHTNAALVWTAVASSSDGLRLTAVTAGGVIYLSADGGTNWNSANSPASARIASVTSSSDGGRLAFAIGDAAVSGNIYGSSDAGSTWPQLIGAPTLSWSGIASSADGSVLAAVVHGGNIYISSQSSTTSGSGGYLVGGQHSTIELIYVGNGIFMPLNHEGNIRAY